MRPTNQPRRGRISARLGCLALVLCVSPGLAQSRPGCPSRLAAGQAIDRGWSAYRKGDVAVADAEFKRALSLCPNDAGALTGAGYAAMRRGRLTDARTFFRLAVATDSTSYDAVAGSGMAAYRAGDLVAARRSFERALQIVPRDSTALSYLAKIPEQVVDVAPRIHVRPTTTTIAARTGKRIFEIPDARGRWSPMWIKAVNLGAALPGKHPSEFPPNDSTYEKWIALLADMGANAVRVYTIHPPHFYAALRTWNLAHPSRPIWLIHGVWTELPPGKKREKYDDPQWLGQFRGEMRHVVSLLHGDAAIPPSPGHASGVYRADVSQWTLGYIIGREWEPYSVVAYNASRPTRTSFGGKYVTLHGGNALEAWLAEQCDYLVGFEMDQYNAQRPVAYTNWPTLDPLIHPTETTKAQEIALLRARGEKIVEMSKEYDNDAVGLDAVKMHATAAFPAGVFASYHAYPYYPDFLIFDPVYSKARSPEGPSNYFGYLRELVAHHGEMPVVISEYGVPSSRGIAHFQPQGWNHGGLTEEQQAAADARLTRDIYASGAAGAGLFSLIDEWFKKNWIVIDFEVPTERKRLWLNPLDAEENYGVIAMRPGRKGSGITIDGDTADWRARPVLYAPAPPRAGVPSLQLRSLRVAQDDAYLYLRLDVGQIDWPHAHYQIGIDTYRRNLGDTRLPHTGSRAPTGLEFVLDIGGPGATELLVDHPYNPYRPVLIPGSKPPAIQYVYSHPLRTVANDAAQWDSVVVVPNRRRIGRSGQIYPAVSYNRNRLLYSRESQNSLADWFADPASGVIEVRLPWGMLQVVDPSTRSVLFGNTVAGEAIGATTDGFRFVVESYDPANPQAGADHFPRGTLPSGFADPPTWTWPNWESPQWHAEVKPLFGAMQRTFGSIPDHPPAR
ncbi:MAG TPA: tetratricopeptide repeat protein [Gemmatimonadaceae bacterium]|nr:tetratricopeptide repeat protein [Gemmatimonadaceae bacterium]